MYGVNEKFLETVVNHVNNKDFVIIDPPWNYPMNRYSNALWDGIGCIDIFQNITVNELFLWVTTENLFSMFSAYQESMYEFKALIPRASLMPNEDLFTSIESGFKNPVEFLAVFRLPKVPQHTARTSTRSLIVEEVNPMAAKPVRWEDRLIHEMAEKGLSGMYLLPEGQVGYCDSIVQSNKRLQKKELF